MGFNAHRGTAGHSIGASIMAKGDTPTPSLKAPTNLSAIRMEFGDNGGVSVMHRQKAPKGTKGEDVYSHEQEQTHMFTNHREAHQHIGTLLGISKPNPLKD